MQLDAHGDELFWDGFQWVPRNRKCFTFDPRQTFVEDKIQNITGQTTKENLKMVANSRTVLIDNIPLDLGLTPQELQKFFMQKLKELGYGENEI